MSNSLGKQSPDQDSRKGATEPSRKRSARSKRVRSITNESARVDELVDLAMQSTNRNRRNVKNRVIDKLKLDILKFHNMALTKSVPHLTAIIACGDLLLAAKEEVGHGKFLNWLNENFERTSKLCTRTAQRYMRQASKFRRFLKNRGNTLDSNTTLVSFLKDQDTVSEFTNPPLSDDVVQNRGKRSGVYPFEEWETPEKIVAAVRKVMESIDCDPAASQHFQVADSGALVFDRFQDGLSPQSQWVGNVFASPGVRTSPAPWLEKAKNSVADGSANSVILLFSAQFSTDTFLELANRPICLIRDEFQTRHHNGKNFRDFKLTAPLAAAIYAGPAESRRFVQVFQELGPIFVPLAQMNGDLNDNSYDDRNHVGSRLIEQLNKPNTEGTN